MLRLTAPSLDFWDRWYGAQQIALLSGDVAMEVFTLGELDKYSTTCTAPRREVHEALDSYIQRHRLHQGGRIVLDSLLKTLSVKGGSNVGCRGATVHAALDARIKQHHLERV